MTSHTDGWRIGVDTGGTFTDLVAVSGDGRTVLRKVSSTPSRPSDAVLSAIDKAGVADDGATERFVLGTTIATNSVIQRKGAPVILLTTEGYEDILYIQRIDRPAAYDLNWVKALPFAERRRTIGVRERVLADGTIHEELSADEIRRVVEEIRRVEQKEGGATIAIGFLFSYLNGVHERQLAEALRSEFPHLPISISSEVAPVWREYERTSTTVMDAYVHHTIEDFVQGLREGLTARQIQEQTALLKSNGGQVPLDAATRRPVDFVLSGLSGGMIAGHFWSGQVGSDKAITLDVGGTSADIGVVIDGQLQFSGSYEVEWGVPLALPVIDVTTIGAGGSSLATVEPGGLLRVGPESAGADPGPAAYGKGGTTATVTDANLVLGRLNPLNLLGGELRLDRELAREAVGRIASELGLEVEETAEAIIAVAVDNMAGAARLVTVDRGYDYRDFDLVAFGGAGPLHAVAISTSLGIRRTIIPPAPGLVSAFGALIADERIDRRSTLVRRLHLDDGSIAAALADLAAAAAEELVDQTGRPLGEVNIITYVSCRYVGQNYEQEIRTYSGRADKSFEMAIPVNPGDPDLTATLQSDFHAAHLRSYGYCLEDQPIESVYLGVTALIPGSPTPLQPYDGDGQRHQAEIYINDAGWANADIVDRGTLSIGERVSGPAVITETTSTTYVPEGFVAEVDRTYCLIVTQLREVDNENTIDDDGTRGGTE